MQKHQTLYTYLVWGISLVLLIVNIFWFLHLFSIKEIAFGEFYKQSPGAYKKRFTEEHNATAPALFDLVCVLENKYCCTLYTRELKTKIYQIQMQLNSSIKNLENIQFNGTATYKDTNLILTPTSFIQENGQIAKFCIKDSKPTLAGFNVKVLIKYKQQEYKMYAPLEIHLH